MAGTTLERNVAVTYAGAQTPVPGMNGAACPDLVYPNYGDWGFVKVQLDPRSFDSPRAHLAPSTIRCCARCCGKACGTAFATASCR